MKTVFVNVSIGSCCGAVVALGMQTAMACDCNVFSSESLRLSILQVVQIDGADAELSLEEDRWAENPVLSKTADGSFALEVEDSDVNTRLTLEEAK